MDAYEIIEKIRTAEKKTPVRVTLTVKAPCASRFSVVLWEALIQRDNSRSSLMPPQAAFIAFGVPSSP